jgi:hypothetical protein
MGRMKVQLTTQEHQDELARKHKQRVTYKLDHDFGIDLMCTTELVASVKKHRRMYDGLVIDGLQYLTPKDMARVVLLVGILSLWRCYPRWK